MRPTAVLIVLSLVALGTITGCAQQPLAPVAAPANLPALPPGAYIDPAVVRWGQTALQVTGFTPDTSNGDLTPGTRSAVAAFQQSRGLPLTAAFDDVTLQALSVATGLRSPHDPPVR